MPNAVSNKNICHVGNSLSLVLTPVTDAVGDKCNTRRHAAHFKQWIQYYDVYSVRPSSSRRVLLCVYGVFVGLFVCSPCICEALSVHFVH